MNRGSVSDPATSVPGRRCFNEAPIHESGKCRPDASTPFASRGFNEAPIHESGKFETPPKTPLKVLGCFNEAPIHESGKFHLRHEHIQEGKPASMRPRFMNRGSNSRAKLRSDREILLQ